MLAHQQNSRRACDERKVIRAALVRLRLFELLQAKTTQDKLCHNSCEFGRSKPGHCQVKAGGSTVVGRHDESIVGLGFQQAASLAGRDTSSAGLAETTADITTAGSKLDNNASVVEEARGSGGTSVATNKQGGANRLGGERGRRRAAGGARGRLDSEPGEATEDGEGEAGFESVVLSASIDGVIRAWEILGKSEKYRMRHPAGVEVTSMLVLPGGSVLVTGENLARLQLTDGCACACLAVAAPGPSSLPIIMTSLSAVDHIRCALDFSQNLQETFQASCICRSRGQN